MNVINKGPRLESVVMPLVRLLKSSGLSWSMREEIAEAIREATRHHKSMEDEQNQTSQMRAAGQVSGVVAQTVPIQGYQQQFKSGV